MEDWRRENVNLLVQQVEDTIKSIKPYVQFGISPFGVWRNRDIRFINHQDIESHKDRIMITLRNCDVL